MVLTKVSSGLIEDNSIIDADVNSAAAIAKTKLASLDIINSDINASAAIAQSKLAIDITNSEVNASAAIAQSKLATLVITDANVAADAISGSKIHSGIISDFASIGIDDNANSLAITIDSSERVGIGTATPATTLDVTGTDAIIIPVGTTAQRPGSPETGMMRFNSTTTRFEGYNGTAWVNIDTLYS